MGADTPHGHCRLAWIILICVLAVSTTRAEEPEPPKLPELLTAYFRAESPDVANAALAEVVTSSGGAVADVAAALAEVELWDAPDEPTFEVKLSVGDGRAPIRLRVTLPDGYNAAKRYPVLVTVGDVPLLESMTRESVVIRIPPSLLPPFHEPYQISPDEWLRAVRRSVHLDEDRVFLVGCGTDGDRGLLTILRWPDAFAGGVLLQSTLDVPYAHVLVPMLLDQVRSMPVVLGWDRSVLTDDEPTSGRALAVAIVNELLADHAADAKVPLVPIVGDDEDAFWEGSTVAELLVGRRSTPNAAIKRFRFGGEAELHGVRVRQADADWSGDVIDIATPDVAIDGDDYVRRVLNDKLAIMQVGRRGQEIRIECSSGRGVDVRMPCDGVDFTKPVTIFLNGKRRFEGRLTPGIRTMLEEARQSWSFQHPICARVRIGPRGDGEPY